MPRFDVLALPGPWMLRRSSTIAFALFLGGVVLVFSQQFLHCFPPPKLFAQTVLLYFALAAALAARTFRPRHFPAIPLIVVLLYCAAAGLRAFSAQALTLHFLPVASAGIAAWLAASLGLHAAERRRLWGAFLFANLACCAYGILQYFGFDWMTWSVDYGTGRVFSTLGNPNFLAGQVAFVLPLLMALCLGSGGWTRLLAQFGVAAAFLVLILAQTRSAWIGVFASICLGLAFVALKGAARRWKWRALLGPGIAILLSGAAFSFPHLNPTGISLPTQLASSLDIEQASARQRFFWWLGAMELLKRRPLIGVGLGDFPREFPSAALRFYRPFADLRPAFCDHPHNDYLYVLCELGILGIGLMLWLAAVWARLLLLSAGRGNPLALGGFLALVSVFVHAFWNMPFNISATFMTAAYATGLSVGFSPLPATSPSIPRGAFLLFLRRSLAVGAAVLAVGIAVGRNPGTMLIAQSYLNGARIMKERFAFSPAIYLARQSLKLTDAPWRQHFLLGSIHYGQGEGHYAFALKEFRLDEAENPWGADAVLHQGKALRQLKRYDEAEERARYALSLAPNYTAAAVTIASLEYYRARDRRDTPEMDPHLARALVWLDYALRFSPRNPEALKLKGYVGIMSRQWELAQAAWDDYLSVRPEDEAMRSRLASLERTLPRLLKGEILESPEAADSAPEGR